LVPGLERTSEPTLNPKRKTTQVLVPELELAPVLVPVLTQVLEVALVLEE